MDNRNRDAVYLLRRARRKKGWSQDRLAKELTALFQSVGEPGSITGGAIGHWETRRHPINMRWRAALEVALGMPRGELVYAEGPSGDPDFLGDVTEGAMQLRDKMQYVADAQEQDRVAALTVEEDLRVLARMRAERDNELYRVSVGGDNPRELRALEREIAEFEAKLKAEGRYRDVYLTPDGIEEDAVAIEIDGNRAAAASGDPSALTAGRAETVARTREDATIDLLIEIRNEVRKLNQRLGSDDANEPMEDAEGDA